MEYAAEADVPCNRRIECPFIKVWSKQHSNEYQREVQVVRHVAVCVALQKREADADVIVVGVLVDEQRDDGVWGGEREE